MKDIWSMEAKDMAGAKNILMVEDTQSLAITYQAYLRNSSYSVEWVDNLADARLFLEGETPDLLLLDLELPDGNGLELLKEISETAIETQVVVMTAYGSSDIAEESIAQGAFDYLTKPFNANRLLVTLSNAEKQLALNQKVSAFYSAERSRYCGFIGASIVMQTVYRTIESLAASSAIGFIVGESGTGKKLAAEVIHQKSRLGNSDLQILDCSAIPQELMESELFGHLKGAFSDAKEGREGVLKAANGGTLFLDEICELDLELQKKLLRFLQTGAFQKIGSNQTEEVDVRFVCATSKDPLEEVRAGKFREDLYYRLNVVPVQLPPLRDRDEDVLLIAQQFLEDYSSKESKAFHGFSKSVKIIFRNYEWPGNVRELDNCIRNIVLQNSGTLVMEDMVPEDIRESAFSGRKIKGISRPLSSGFESPDTEKSSVEPLWRLEKQAIQNAISVCDGNIIKAASLLEVAPSTIYRKLQSWEES